MIEPALTAEEWEQWREQGFAMHDNGADEDDVLVLRDGGRLSFPVAVGRSDALAKIAALALYGQPFGFTRGDVEVLRQKAVWGGPQGEAPDSLADRIEAFWEALDSLADRIESLLPPETKTA